MEVRGVAEFKFEYCKFDDFCAFKSDGYSETFLGKFEFVLALRNVKSFYCFERQVSRNNA